MMEKEAAEAPTDSDLRRAAALMIHHSRRDAAGVNAVLVEASEANRTTELVMAVLDLFAALIPAIHTPLGIQLLSDCVIKIAGEEENP